MPTINFTLEEIEKHFHDALCNAVGTGYMDQYGIEVDFDDNDYKTAKEKLESPCYEDILMQILRDGKGLIMKDVEGEGDNTKSITIQDVYDRFHLIPMQYMVDLICENDDATTADVIIQIVFYKEIIFG